jgi:hypothetical protein
MGLTIRVTINPDAITAEEWAAVYEESLLLLEKFPVPLMRLVEEARHEQKCYVYTPAIVEGRGTSYENWRISGDLVSYQHGETFDLHRDRAREFRERRNEDDRDVLWADGDDLHDPTGNGYRLFGGKTQGYPYHLAVLAVAILLESRFSQRAFVFGDIERFQVEQMVQWANAILATPVVEPVCFDGERLYHRLTALYSDPALVIARFKTLFLGTEEEAFAWLLRLADESAVIHDFKTDLRHYQSLNQIGVIKLISKFLSVTPDLPRLIALVLAANQIEPERKPFTLQELLKVLCQHFVTITPADREPLDLFIRKADTLLNIQDTFMQIFLNFGGAPSVIDYFMESASLLDHFAAHAPKQRARFRKIITEAEQLCRERLQEVQDLINQLEKAEAARTEEGADEQANAQSASELTAASFALPGAAYILQQVYRQQEHFPEVKTLATALGQPLQKIMQTHADLFSVVDRDLLLTLLTRATYEQQIILRASAWQRIDQERDLTILRRLLALTLISRQEATFWRLRIYVLEHSKLWPYLIAPTEAETGA